MLCMARADPGQVTAETGWESAGGDESEESEDIEEGELPKRTHKSRLYPKPSRRYEHYCRWLRNVVGLLHLEFPTALSYCIVLLLL